MCLSIYCCRTRWPWPRSTLTSCCICLKTPDLSPKTTTSGTPHRCDSLTLKHSFTYIHCHLYLLFDEIKGAEDQDLFSCSFSDSLSNTLLHSLVAHSQIYSISDQFSMWSHNHVDEGSKSAERLIRVTRDRKASRMPRVIPSVMRVMHRRGPTNWREFNQKSCNVQ